MCVPITAASGSIENIYNVEHLLYISIELKAPNIMLTLRRGLKSCIHSSAQMLTKLNMSL